MGDPIGVFKNFKYFKLNPMPFYANIIAILIKTKNGVLLRIFFSCIFISAISASSSQM